MFKRIILLFFAFVLLASANPWNGKIILQGFWWDYWNENYQNNWATYLAKLAPRLRAMGIDGVWIPPTVKNSSTGSNGYAPFDHYDLGDKYQKGSTTTRFGDKDEYLRAVAVLHANGLDVIQDVVWNHLTDAGAQSGAGGEDPEAWSNKYKNFRYVCYKDPVFLKTAEEYYGREGRFPKNWQNFHPNPDHNQENDDWTSGSWGPDICYYENAYGQSSNCTYNPEQSANYMRDGMRAWNLWLKKQTGVDGYRIDAAKHFPYWATKDFLWNLAYSADWASGGETMFAAGEYIGNKQEIDQWVDDVNNSDGFTDVVGTFDLPFRQALHDMVYGFDNYDMGSIPGQQQDRRNRTVPFVNNHDTFRPIVDADGNYDQWDTYNELAGGHIDPREPRAPAAYAIALAVDGSPEIFFEDLFDVGTTGMRYSHHPENEEELPARDFLVNLIWCHQKLNFKDGAYKVRWQAQDLLVIERSAKALIAANDNWANAQTATVQTDFGPNVQLHDYSGANSSDIRTDSEGKATIWVPPCDGSNLRRGYAVWGPAGIEGGFSPPVRSTTQEWEMADNLGDRHSYSLKEGGRLPENSTALRTVCRVWGEAGQLINIEVFPEDAGQSYTIELYSTNDLFLGDHTATGNSSLQYLPSSQNWLVVKARNTADDTPGQKLWVKITYTGPQTLNLNDTPLKIAQDREQPRDFKLLGNYPNPFGEGYHSRGNPGTRISWQMAAGGHVVLAVFNTLGQKVRTLVDEQRGPGVYSVTFDAAGLPSGIYFYQLSYLNKGLRLSGKMLLVR